MAEQNIRKAVQTFLFEAVMSYIDLEQESADFVRALSYSKSTPEI